MKSEVNIVNSTFISSSPNIIQGQIYLEGSKLTVDRSNFLNSTSRYASAIFSNNDGNIEITNSRFKNLHANKTAGAIGVKKIQDPMISNCTFDNISSANNGGAIFADINGNELSFSGSVMIKDTLFNNCHSNFGGSLLQLGGLLNILNSNFTSIWQIMKGVQSIQVMQTWTLKTQVSNSIDCWTKYPMEAHVISIREM